MKETKCRIFCKNQEILEPVLLHQSPLYVLAIVTLHESHHLFPVQPILASRETEYPRAGLESQEKELLDIHLAPSPPILSSLPSFVEVCF